MLLRLLLSVGSGIVDLVSGLFRKEQDHTYTAEFGNEAEHISRFNYGFVFDSSDCRWCRSE